MKLASFPVPYMLANLVDEERSTDGYFRKNL